MDSLLKKYRSSDIKRLSIGSLITRVTTKGKSKPEIEQVYVVSNTLGIVRSEDYHENEIHSENTSNYTIIEHGMFAYNPSRLNIGSLGVLEYEEAGLVSPMYIVFKIDETIITKEYLLLLLKSSAVMNKIDSLKEEGARFRFDFTRWDKIIIPIPSIDIQREIVSILNTFKSLEAGLIKEQQLREKQYEYFSHKLITSLEDSKLYNVTEICDDVFLGLTAKVDYVEEDGIPLVRANNMTTGELKFEDVKYISKEQHDKLTKNHKAQYGDLLISKSGTLGVVCLVDTDKEFSIYESLICLHPNENVYNKYLLYLLRTPEMQQRMLQKKVGNAIKHLNLLTFKELYIPLPSIEKQKEIAKALEIFDVLCHDTQKGLPAEIEARRKQYEYYRDLLLEL